MPVQVGNRRTSFGSNNHFGHNNSSSCCDSTRRVKVFDSRRKQRWVDPILTPPRSPESPVTDDEIPEPILDDIFGLWEGAGLQDLGDIITDEFGQELNVASALSELDMGFENEFLSSSPIPFPPGDSISDDDESDHLGEQLDRLFNYVSDNSPPPTNPPSPPGELDSTYCSSSGNSSCNSSQYDEGFIGEDLINEQPDIFDQPIGSTDTCTAFSSSIFEEDLGIKNDCMWGVNTLDDLHHKDELIKEFGHSQIKMEVNDEDEVEMKWTGTLDNFWGEEESRNSNASMSSNEHELKYSEELEIIRHGTNNDHTYCNPSPSDVKSKDVKSEKSNNCSSYSNNSSKKNHKSNHTIPGIIIKEEETDSDQHCGPKKTKILVPLKDLMESLQQKTFLVAPLGPGKKVIRLTGKETVKGMLGVHTSHLSQRSNSCRPMSNHSHVANKIKMKKARAKMVKERLDKIKEESSIVSSTTASPESPSSSSVAPLKPKKTKTHNNMERLRRIDLRNSFDNLKKLVPVLAKSAKCSKVEILRRAEEYVKAIRTLEKRLVREEAIVRNRNEALKLKLAQLQSQSA